MGQDDYCRLGQGGYGRLGQGGGTPPLQSRLIIEIYSVEAQRIYTSILLNVI